MTGVGHDLTTRPLRFDGDVLHPDDLAAAARVVEAYERELLGEAVTGERLLVEQSHSPHLDRTASSLVLDGPDAVAVVWVAHHDIPHHTFVDLTTVPSAHRRAVLELAVGLGIDAGRRRQADADGVTWHVRAGTWLADTAYHSLLDELGFAPIRRFSQMRIDAASPDVPGAVPDLPEGVEIVVARDESDYRRLYEVDSMAFLGHWNFTVEPYEDWRREIVESPSRDPEGMWLLTVDDVPAGICIVDDSHLDAGEGYVAILGILPEYRGRGLAQLLLRTAFVRDRDRGRVATRLAVDSENTTGAVRLYEGVGMTQVLVREAWNLTLPS